MNRNPLDKFEQGIQDAYKNYELPCSSSEFTQMSRRLLRKRLFSGLALWGSAAVITAVVGVSAYLIISNESTSVASSIPNAPEVINSVSEPEVADGNSSSTSENKTGLSNIITVFHSDVLTNSSSNDQLNVESNKPNSEIPKESTKTDASNNTTTAIAPEIKNRSLYIEPSVRSACAGTEVNFTAKNSSKNGSYLWNFGDGSFSNQENPVHIYKKSGTFDVSLSVTNPNDGQISTIAMRDLITINPKPEADFEWSYTNSPVGEPTAKFVNTSVNANSFLWKFTENRTSSEVSPSVIYNSKGKQSVILEVQNTFGCKDEQVKIVQVNADFNLGAELKMSEKDIAFMPEALKKGVNKFKLSIYDGENIIFESTTKSKVWKGEMKGGKKALAGQQFPWIVLIYGEEGNDARYYSGTLTIVP
ncbi:MAG: PKD domain-containing protein [Sediminibacterium sp.]